MDFAEATAYWDQRFTISPDQRLSWFEPIADLSLELIAELAPARGSRIVDIGGGSSRLGVGLAALGYRNLTILDLSRIALERSRALFADSTPSTRFIQGDVRSWVANPRVDVWHDRAALHFLVSAEDRAAYARNAALSVQGGGWMILMGFALGGALRCSGLPVQPQSESLLMQDFASDFAIVRMFETAHRTPESAQQLLHVALLQRKRLDRDDATHVGD